MESGRDYQNAKIIGWLLLSVGILFLIFAAIYNEYLFKLLRSQPPISRTVIETIRSVQIFSVLIGLVLVVLGEAIGKIPSLRHIANGKSAASLILSCLILFSCLIFIELFFRPFAARGRTTIFMEDRELGWKMRPGAEDAICGVYCKINGKGLIGPELEYAKLDKVMRILYLGDSITFGYGVPGYRNVFPYVIEDMLEQSLGRNIETVNAGVNAYRTSQEYIYLTRDGYKYHPDLVVLAFALNDVTDLINQVKGKPVPGYSASDGQVLTLFDRFYFHSGIMYAVRNIRNKFRTHGDDRLGGFLWEQNRRRAETQFIKAANRPDYGFAWNIVISDLEKIKEFCQRNDFPLLLVLFPYKEQLTDTSGVYSPQDTLKGFAAGKNVKCLDLLPGLIQNLKDTGAKPSDYYWDELHPNVEGNKVIAGLIADFIIRLRLGKPGEVLPTNSARKMVERP